MGSEDLFKKQKYNRKNKGKKLEKQLKESILIVCEGEKTEPNYFKSFPNSGIKIEIIGEGRNTNSLVNAGIKHWKALSEEGFYYENMYIVMDRDSFTIENYNKAFQTIINFENEINKKKKYKRKLSSKFKAEVIYSNEAFELWYLLHYDYHDTAINRRDYEGLLTKKLNKPYKKNDYNIYSILKNISDKNKGLQFAINNSIKLRRKNTPQENPSTNVDILVKELICKYCESKKVKCENKDYFYYP